MTDVRLADIALEDLEELILTHGLPRDTRPRVARSIAVLAEFPRIGPELEGRWAGFRRILGPWPWLLIVYVYDEGTDGVLVVTIQDARASTSATSS